MSSLSSYIADAEIILVVRVPGGAAPQSFAVKIDDGSIEFKPGEYAPAWFGGEMAAAPGHCPPAITIRPVREYKVYPLSEQD